jgi:hypothetical protein
MKNMPEQDLREMIQTGIHQAQSYGVTDEVDIE